MNWYKQAAKQKLIKGIPKSCQMGDCYCASGRYLMDHGINNPNLVMVHGEVIGQGAISGVSYGHAWLEEGDEVLDISNGRNLRLPKMVYYALGQIDPAKTYRYTYKDMQRKVNDTGHWGPWDLKTQY